MGIDDLIEKAEAYAQSKGLSLSTVSRKILNDGKGLDRLKSGGQCTIKTLQRAYEVLDGLNQIGDNQNAQVGAKPVRANPAKSENAPIPSRAPLLAQLEAESIHILREVVAVCKSPVLLYSIGKDSSVLLHLARKAFYPAPIPFPVLHIDTGWKFKEMINFRDRIAKDHKLDLRVYTNTQGQHEGVSPLDANPARYTEVMKTEALKGALDAGGYDAAFGGARRDEERSRAKERIFSFRTPNHHWNPKAQRPELWHIYNARVQPGESLRVFPLSNWTEGDIWAYILQENIDIPDLYLARPRPVVQRNGQLIMVDDARFKPGPNEQIKTEMVRFRTLGCYPLSGAIKSQAQTLEAVVEETLGSPLSEREGRIIDYDPSASMEDKKRAGYF